MSRPVIGICVSVERARWTYWDEEAAVLSMNYVRQVQEAGGIAVLLAPHPEPEEMLRLLDGLLLTGGADIGDVPERVPAHPAGRPAPRRSPPRRPRSPGRSCAAGP